MILSRLNFSVSSPMLFSLSLFCSCWHCNYTLQCHTIRKLVATARHQQKKGGIIFGLQKEEVIGLSVEGASCR